MPSVSILIPCYNAAAWIEQAVESALSQELTDVEVIIVDDGSTDDSPRILERLEARIRWERQTKNRGSNATRNRLLELSQGNWVQFLDADDYLLPGKIARQLERAVSDDVGIIVSPVRHENGWITHWGESSDPWVRFFRAQLGVTSANLWRKSDLQTVAGWNPDQPICQEYELMLRLMKRGTHVAFVDHALAVHRDSNPGSIFNRSHALGHYMYVLLIKDALQFLDESGQLTPYRELEAATCIFSRAQKLYALHSEQWHEALATVRCHASTVEPLLRRQPPWYRVAYRVAGFRSAETLRISLNRMRISLNRMRRFAVSPLDTMRLAVVKYNSQGSRRL